MTLRYSPFTFLRLTQIICHSALTKDSTEGQLYEKNNTSLIVDEYQGIKDTHLTSNSSSFGFRGKKQLERNTAAPYQLKYEITQDERAAANNSIFKQRNAFVGLDTSLGTLIAESHDTPLKMIQTKIDQFNNLPIGVLKNLMEGKVGASDVALYTSPTVKNIQIQLATQAKEDGEGKDGTTAAINYRKHNLYLDAATAQQTGNPGLELDATRVAAQDTIDHLKLLTVQKSLIKLTMPNMAGSSAAYTYSKKLPRKHNLVKVIKKSDGR
ncbi:porin [Teredinibacter haidensis]|uniref:porin n=1 Tax=Teredinibacter haidensis TaxID=2731755 RepID=UPI000948EC6E|nr:porin [Teredinibacter haidensis]